MARSRRALGSTGSFLVALVLVVIGIGAGGYLATRDPSPAGKGVSGNTPAPIETGSAVRPSPKQTVNIYVINTSSGESVLVPEKRRVSARLDKYEAAMDLLLESAGSHRSAIPKGTRLRSIEIADNLAVVDLSREFIDNFSGGSEEESLAINAIVQTISQFGDVKKVQITVEGQKIGTLGGHFELEEPIEVSMSLETGGVSE